MISSSIIKIGEGAFMNCENLESVRLEDGVYYVGMNAFLNCPELQKIYLAKSVKVFEDNAFNGCDNVTFELIKNTTAYKYIKNNTDFNIKIKARLLACFWGYSIFSSFSLTPFKISSISAFGRATE